MEIGFRKRLAHRQINVNSLVCVGLDPIWEKLPKHIIGDPDNKVNLVDLEIWAKKIVDATAPFASLYKPQSAHWESISGGRAVMQAVIAHIKKNYPSIPVFLDCKRGDIGRTQARYREAHIVLDGVDGMNFSPYMGKDCMQYLVTEAKIEAIVGLCYTSNYSARHVQDFVLSKEQTRKLGFEEERVALWEAIGKMIVDWGYELGVNENTGLVMAAAYKPKQEEAEMSETKSTDKVFSYHLSRCREIVGDKAWLLIPGIGTQGGEEKETVEDGYVGPGSVAINSSSGIIFARDGEDFAEAAGGEAEKLRDKFRAVTGTIN